ncbi:MAG: mannose-6-phosphate isomerase [Chloroflexi bacterium]|nr:MAG: mannose-6-phosphate isomerase [Chloroflexota bacterium]
MRLGAPIPLGPNRMRLFYQGGALIDELRGAKDPADGDYPEDWIGSVTAFGGDRPPTEGLSRVRVDGWEGFLRDLVRERADELVGRDLAHRYGATTGLLVKLLDTSVRLPVHCHPTRDFARRKLGSVFGKTEAWIVVATRRGGAEEPYARVGFQEAIPRERLLEWTARQDVGAIVAATHKFAVRAGDVVLIAAGLPHAIGPGVFMVEVQEPTNYSILLEHAGFPIASDAAHLGLGWEAAIDAVDRHGYAREELVSRFVRRVDLQREGESPLVGDEFAEFFRATRVHLGANGSRDIPAGYWVGVVLEGSGEIEYGAGRAAIRRGDTFCVPFALGSHRLRGGRDGIAVVRCLPPAR